MEGTVFIGLSADHPDGRYVNTPKRSLDAGEQQIADVLVVWMRGHQGGWRSVAIYAAWGVVVSIALVELPIFGLLLMSVFFMRSVFQVFRILGLGFDVLAVLKPALNEHPEGLGDVGLAFAVFDAARIDRIGGRRRTAALRRAAMEIVGPDGPASDWDCSMGHGVICAHRTERAAVEFWRSVAAG